MTATAAGLHHAHEQQGADRRPLGIVHRDVSPGNILIGYDGAVKVVDFGIAKASTHVAETHSTALKGKVGYMAPEQVRGRDVDRRADVYALGVVLYEATTVRRLFKGSNDYLTMAAIVEGEYPRPSELREDCPPALEAIILKALARDRADRYDTAEAMRLALEAFAKEANLRGSSTALADFMVAQFGRRPEPWLDATQPERAATDFDGSDSGLARASTGVRENLEMPPGPVARPSAPIMRAREQALSDAPPFAVASAVGSVVLDADAPHDLVLAPTPRERRWWIGVCAAVVAAGIAFVAVASSGGGDGNGDGGGKAADERPVVATPTAAAAPIAPETPPAALPAAPSIDAGAASAASAAVAAVDPVGSAGSALGSAASAGSAGAADSALGSAGSADATAAAVEPVTKPSPAKTPAPRPPPSTPTSPAPPPKPKPPAKWDPNQLFPK
jgi:hypothetical protein